MRSFPATYLLIFAIIYFILSAVFYINIRAISINSFRRRLPLLSIIYSLLIVVFFIALFIYPGRAAESTHYNIYFVFNIILIADLVSKITLLIFSIPYLILKLFNKAVTFFIYGGLIISTGIYLSVIYGAFAGKTQIQVKYIETEFPNLPDSFDGYRIVQVSDIHLGSFFHKKLLQKTANRINQIHPDVLLFTGDLVNNFSEETKGWEQVFNSISAKNGKYSVLGNHDYGNYYNWNSEVEKRENFEAIVSAYKRLGFNLLRNESVALINKSDTCYLVGVENWGHPPFPQYADLDKALLNVPEASFKILMTHDPAHWEIVRKKYPSIDLSLSGHTHGLQWGIKPAGIEFSLIKAGSKFWGGLYQFGNQYLHVNRGLGTIGMNLRLDMPAEITVITLTKK